MLKYTIEDEVYLRSFTMNDSEEFYNLVINSKEYLEKGLPGLILLRVKRN
ncbi:hypothetical protein [Salimicrobium salexigens]|nr:hypothetical protein [Salimicrobium salexigens]